LDPEILARRRWRQVERAAGKRDELGRRLQEARARAAELTSTQPGAEQRDREARGLALAEGKPAPHSEAEKTARELDEARSLVQDLDAAAAVVQHQFQEVLDANRESWGQAQGRAIDQAGNGVLSALAGLEKAVGKLEDERGLLAWIEPVPAEGPSIPTVAGSRTRALLLLRSTSFAVRLPVLQRARNLLSRHLGENSLGSRSVWPLRPSLVGVVSGARSPLPSLRLSPSLSREG
jgi:hypothetical protein